MNVGKDLTETFQGLVFARRKVNGQMSSIASSNGDISSSSPSSDVEGTKKHPILGTKKQSPFMVSCKMVVRILATFFSFTRIFCGSSPLRIYSNDIVSYPFVTILVQLTVRFGELFEV